MMGWLFNHAWIVPLTLTFALAILAYSMLPSYGDSGPDGAAEYAFIVPIWLALTALIWVVFIIYKLIF